MSEPSNRVVQVSRFGEPEDLRVVDAPMPVPGRGEVRVRVLASGIEYTDVPIRRHLYPQTAWRRAPFVMGYDVVGEIDQLGEDVTDFQLGERVADMTVVGSNARYRTLRAKDLTRMPKGVDAAEAAALILSWTTAHQLLHRAAQVKPGQKVLVQGAAGAVGQALLVLGKMADLQMWGTARDQHLALVRGLGATPIDYQREDFTHVLQDGFDVVFDGVGENGFRRSFAALKPDGLLCAYGYSASVQGRQRLFSVILGLARVYLERQALSWMPGGKHVYIYSINAMRARHPDWFKDDLARLFSLLAAGAIRPRVAERINFDQVADAHRRLEAGGLDGKLVLCPRSAEKERIIRSMTAGDQLASRTNGMKQSDPAERGWLRYFYRNWRPTRFGRVWSKAYAWITGLGLMPDILTTLQVCDRLTGKLTSTVLVATRYEGQIYLVSMLGNQSEWVQNVRAANGVARLKRWTITPIKLIEIPAEQRAPILKAWCRVATSGRKHLPVAPDDPVSLFKAIAADYPVFRVDPI